MKKVLLIIALSISILPVFSQRFLWQVQVNPFFDNTEFGGSTVIIDQTMAGVHLAPAVGLEFEKYHRIIAGTDLMQEFGSKNFIDTYNLIAYYNYENTDKKTPVNFYMGAFPRKYAVEDYPRIFFQDSINFYRPIMTGLAYQLGDKDKHANIWLDWTGKQSTTQREMFFVGMDARYPMGIFYTQLYSYLTHYAKMLNHPDSQYINDNGMLLASVGIDLSKKIKLNKLTFSAGFLGNLEDNRGTTGWLFQKGLYLDFNLEYKRLGLKNTFYTGDKLMHFYPLEGNKLYWGDPNYRLSTYNRTDIYVKLFDSKIIKGKLMYSLHATQGKIYHEQSLLISADLNNFAKK